MTIQILINGADGKMGQHAIKAINHTEGLLVVAQVGRQDNLVEMIAQIKPDVVLDLTTASAVFKNASQIIQAGVRPVIGTSGLLADQIQLLTAQCVERKLGGLIIPNFSIGAVLAMKYAQDCARYFSDVEIIESHHPQKIDAPSGTAIRTAEMIGEARQKMLTPTSSKETLAGARGANYKNVPIHAIRLPGILARQTVMFGSSGELLTIQHEISDRESYMAGICLACREVMNLNTLLCGLEHILEK